MGFAPGTTANALEAYRDRYGFLGRSLNTTFGPLFQYLGLTEQEDRDKVASVLPQNATPGAPGGVSNCVVVGELVSDASLRSEWAQMRISYPSMICIS